MHLIDGAFHQCEICSIKNWWDSVCEVENTVSITKEQEDQFNREQARLAERDKQIQADLPRFNELGIKDYRLKAGRILCD